MRLWSLHPKHLDAKGLVALWREGLLALAVLRGRTKGYTHHPQLTRLRGHPDPLAAMIAFLSEVRAEALRRGYQFKSLEDDANGAPPARQRKAQRSQRTTTPPITVTTGQLAFEADHLEAKLLRRSPEVAAKFDKSAVEVHPLFTVVEGPVEIWEKGEVEKTSAKPPRARKILARSTLCPPPNQKAKRAASSGKRKSSAK